MNYRESVLRTFNSDQTHREKLTNSAMGLAGEAGEVIDLLKKHLFHKHELDRDKLINELGDCYYYLEVLCDLIDVSPEEVKDKNITKLAKRYPQGFSSEASINRKE